jgi:hypothetical protein
LRYEIPFHCTFTTLEIIVALGVLIIFVKDGLNVDEEPRNIRKRKKAFFL